MTEHALEPTTQLDRTADVVTPRPDAPGGFAGTGVAGGSSGAGDGIAAPAARDAGPEALPSCTQAQLRRFIKSRPYVPLHELRRRFGLNGSDDDVSSVEVDGHVLFVGLPRRECGLLGELLRQGDVGYELLLDPTSPIIIGVFPMRPVQRP
jgi:hypothetical protein